LTGSGDGHRSHCDNYGESRDVVTATIDIADVDADAYIEPVRHKRVSDPFGGSQGGARRREQGEDTVACALDDGAATGLDDGARHRVVTVKHGLPPRVADGRGIFGRRDEIGEHNRGEEALRGRKSAFADDEVGDLGDDGIDIAEEWKVVTAVEFDETCFADE
jgi:hypothetical protein